MQQARQLLLERVRNNPDDVDACHNLGIAALHEGKDEEAIEWFRRVTKLDPNEEFAATQLVKLHAERGEFDAALSDCDRLARIPGMVIKEASLRAQILQACGRTEEAITRLTALVERDPSLDKIWFMLSEIYEREGLRSDALEAAERCLEVLLRFGGNRENIDMIKTTHLGALISLAVDCKGLRLATGRE